MTYCCIDTTSRDFARFGLLYARDGRWLDDQIVSQIGLQNQRLCLKEQAILIMACNGGLSLPMAISTQLDCIKTIFMCIPSMTLSLFETVFTKE